MNSTNNQTTDNNRASNPSGRQGGPRKYHAFQPVGEYVPFGSRKAGLSRENPSNKMVYEINYSINEAQRKELSSRFPNVEIVSRGIVGHDHPIAHVSTKIAWERVLKELPSGARAADVCGNPDVALRFNARGKRSNAAPHIDTFCKVMSVKDAIRAKERWGPKTTPDGTVRWEEMTVYDMWRNDENRQRFRGYSHFLMNHVLYYYTKREINQLLHINPDSMLIATIHKLPGDSGVINGGEQSYQKDLQTGRVTQTNVDTGEFYTHYDPCIWFRDFCYADENGAISWSINKSCEDHYVIHITSCPPNLVEGQYWDGGRIVLGPDAVAEPVGVAQPAPPAYSRKVVHFDGKTAVPGLSGKPKDIVITHPEVFDRLEKFMIGRKRNMASLKDLVAKAHREVGNNVLIGGTGNRINIETEVLIEHIAAAFVNNARFEQDLFDQAATSGGKITGSYSGMVKNTLKVIAAGRMVASSKEPVDRVLRYLDDLYT